MKREQIEFDILAKDNEICETSLNFILLKEKVCPGGKHLLQDWICVD